MLLSGGIDSPVAAYRAMKRGLRCDFVHFSGRPYTGPESIYKSYAHVAQLDRFQGGSRLHVVPFGLVQRRIAAAGAGRLQLLSQRRLMLKVASALARREGAEVLVTGDSLGQVSSQTLHNLRVVEQAADLPVLRPLVAWDKAEIVREAEQIGTFEVSALPGRGLLHAVLEPARRDEGRAGEAELDRGPARRGPGRRRAAGAGAECVRPRADEPGEAVARIACFRADFTIELHREYPELIRGTDYAEQMSVRRPPFARARMLVAVAAAVGGRTGSPPPPRWRRRARRRDRRGTSPSPTSRPASCAPRW